MGRRFANRGALAHNLNFLMHWLLRLASAADLIQTFEDLIGHF